MEALLGQGHVAHGADASGSTPLHFAAAHAHASCVEALAGAIEANGTLLSLGLQNNGLDEASKAALLRAKEASDARRASPLQLVL